MFDPSALSAYELIVIHSRKPDANVIHTARCSSCLSCIAKDSIVESRSVKDRGSLRNQGVESCSGHMEH
jgi:hypothetical protein